MSFKKKTWLNVPDPNNLPPIPEGQDELAIFDADNMNRIEGGIKSAHNVIEVLPINKSGMEDAGIVDVLGSRGFDAYQKPWNVTDRLGVINAFSSDLVIRTGTGKQDSPVNSSFEIPLINSGDFYLHIAQVTRDGNVRYTEGLNPRFAIELNENLLYEFTVSNSDGWSIFYTNVEKPHLISNVKKGDILKLTLRCTSNSNASSANIELSNINLFANADTTCKYISLTPEKGNTDAGYFGSINILDILLGVNE